ncbi:MAG: glycosyltransferase [Bacteroidota bacterium]
MKRVLIVAPHFPPSNLAAVHRTRLFSQHLPAFGWEPVVLTVHHDYYEERLDWNLAKLVPEGLRVEQVKAMPVPPVRVVGDIGIRGFRQMLRRALQLIDEEQIDFLYIPIPSFYAAMLGPIVYKLRGTPYGIDYIDPWVHEWPGADQLFSRHWLSSHLADALEPLAVRHASLITGVARGYYEDVLERNPHLQHTAVTASMPYGGEAEDHRRAHDLDAPLYVFDKEPGTFQFLYAGALLPLAFEPLHRVFQAISENLSLFESVRFHFVGTGTSPNDPKGYKVRPVAEQYGLWGSVVTEHPARIPYLDVLTHLDAADAVFILGSTEPHYTPSKVYQGVLSEKPIFAILHEASTACAVLRSTGAGKVISFDGEAELGKIGHAFVPTFTEFQHFAEGFDPGHVDQAQFETYSARSVTQILAEALDEALERSRTS